MKESKRHPEMWKSASGALERRNVWNSNKNLLDLVKPGHRVLDVGCGAGNITKGIKELAGKFGVVTGIDTRDYMIEMAQNMNKGVFGLSFFKADINFFSSEDKYDVVTSARALQWAHNPYQVICIMRDLVKEGGCLSVLDFSLEKNEFIPALPEPMEIFYKAFLNWREDAGMDNVLADNLADLFEKAGLKNIAVSDQSEFIQKHDAGFVDEAVAWSKIAETHGLQMVMDGYISEELRKKAVDAYDWWMEEEGEGIKLCLKAVTGYVEGAE
ncbi:methyltransferase domain-containing protein [Cytophagaceae bacterium ABcell3]|nr:methyltransferase domain-containing protein [Cytophagaceae bacterium ABcell3]